MKTNQCPICKKFMRTLSYETQVATRMDGTKCLSRFSGNACECGHRETSSATLEYYRQEAAAGRAVMLPSFEG